MHETGKGSHFRDEEDETQRERDKSKPKSESSLPKPGTPPSALVASKALLGFLKPKEVQRKSLPRDKLELRAQVQEQVQYAGLTDCEQQKAPGSTGRLPSSSLN